MRQIALLCALATLTPTSVVLADDTPATAPAEDPGSEPFLVPEAKPAETYPPRPLDAPGEQRSQWPPVVDTRGGEPTALAGVPPEHGAPPELDAHPRPDTEHRAERSIVGKRVLHGFRMGYLFLMNHEQPTDTPDDTECPNCSLQEKYDLKTPHQFLIGYELMARMVGHEWLNVILVGNVMAAGLEQSRFFPSANALVGFELDRSFQVGVGANLSLEEDKPAHMILAAGWTPEVGGFYVPVHGFFIPDVDQNHRAGMTVGVNW